MRGQILTFESNGEGVISGDDGARYRFTAADTRSAGLAQGQQVDFVASDDGQAREIFALTAPSASSLSSGAFDLGRVIQRTFTSIGQNWAVFFGGAAILVGLPSTVSAVGQTNMALSPTIASISAVILGTILYLVGLYMLNGLVMKAAFNGFTGKTTRFADAFDVGVKMILPLLGLGIVAGLGMMVGFLLLIVPGVILCIVWSVSAPALVVEKRGVFDSLQRSRDLTRGYRWQVFGLLVIYVVLAMVTGLFAGVIIGVMGGSLFEDSSNLVVNLITGPVVNVISGVVAAAGAASLYYELRTAKEGALGDDLAAVFD